MIALENYFVCENIKIFLFKLLNRKGIVDFRWKKKKFNYVPVVPADFIDFIFKAHAC